MSRNAVETMAFCGQQNQPSGGNCLLDEAGLTGETIHAENQRVLMDKIYTLKPAYAMISQEYFEHATL